MAQLDSESSRDAIERASLGPIFYLGAAGLISLMTVETLAVIGRHIGRPFLGAIEILQTAILVSACAATVIATLSRAHAAVHLVADRLPPRAKRALALLAEMLATLFFAGLCFGATWLASDFWRTHEETEVLHISYRPLRALTSLTMAVVGSLFLHRAWRIVRGKK